MEYIILGLVLLLIVVLFFLHNNNKKLAAENKVLQEILAVKDTTISNLQVSRVAVKDVIENFSAHEEVMQLVDAGESRESISEKLGIPTSRIELIIKFDKIKKEKLSAS
jgi:cell division protein FtsB